MAARARTASQDSRQQMEVGSQSFADDDVMLDEVCAFCFVLFRKGDAVEPVAQLLRMLVCALQLWIDMVATQPLEM